MEAVKRASRLVLTSSTGKSNSIHGERFNVGLRRDLVSELKGKERRGPRDSDQAVGSPKQSLLATPLGVL